MANQGTLSRLRWQNRAMSDVQSEDMGPWLSAEELQFIRAKVPMLYVDVVPVRMDEYGDLEWVGLLLSVNDDGVSRSLVSGRVLYHESIRDAVMRHIDKDLGPMALPQLPTSIVPFTVGEYFPTPGDGWFDSRQHAVSLAYIVPMAGDCDPSNDTLELTWFTPGEAQTAELQAEMTPSQAALLRRALAFLGYV